MTSMSEEWINRVLWARSEVLALREKHPEEKLLLSASTQLDYLIALAKGVEQDDSSLEDIDIGYLAMYPLSGIVSYDLSVALCDISDRIRRDLRRQGRKSKQDQ